MEIVIGLIIIAIGAFCQSSCYVPINKIKDWSWESYWIVQGVFAWLLLPLLGALLAVPAGHSLFELFTAEQSFNIWMTILFGVLWGVGGLTFGLSMRYLGVALGQSIALGTCAGLGTIMGPVLLNIFFPEQDPLSKLTFSVILGVVVTLVGIAIIGVAGSMKSAGLSEEEKKAAVKDFNFPKGLTIALLAGFMSGCFNVGLTFGADIKFAETQEMFAALPATFLVTLGGFVTNAIYCFYQNQKNKTWGDYKKGSVWGNNVVFCLLAGALWYSQFFGLSLGQSFFEKGGTMFVLSFCILMALNVVFSNVWGIILKEWKGCSGKTISVLIAGIAVLIISTFLPTIIDSLSK
ncbi:rhamnose/proton symporter RhaT [Prevotella communis]|uniref:L-rhamnose/proton symporter RhaT n=1 Tax=Prevotella communis TaxID=2913614 RepID=UPI001EDB51C8|nr:L-rhamnose/proton symporter RhaT [Prevotella communis]UKK60237.1 rhamnose/proton symporter RhaT [Prevotella communis]UKK62971.1 rhamnose/proton symporter RhaT [Prevotella communis]UKK65796.1 rhamnose/proton symporter RhaT [Prevotella communis]UKK68215.1 rhamnose/proton symporter RhaT [Prevotella communis]UKK69650.1 rhamnose/proton symporter RhaT [Prevotella communis]